MINIKEKGSCMILEVLPETIDLANSSEMRSDLQNCEDSMFSHIIMDMSSVKSIDSSGLGVIISYWRYIKDSGKDLSLANCRDTVQTTLENTHINKSIRAFPSVEDACAM